jgi:hypothetical protein
LDAEECVCELFPVVGKFQFKVVGENPCRMNILNIDGMMITPKKSDRIIPAREDQALAMSLQVLDGFDVG